MGQSRYPFRRQLLDVIQNAGLNREGLVASKIFPEVKTATQMFEWIDWAKTDDNNGKFDNMKQADDSVGCTTDVKEIDPSSFSLVPGKVTDHALKMALKDCGESACTPSGKYNFDKDAAKSEELISRLLLGREVRAINTATNESLYTDLAASPATTRDQLVEDYAEGALIDISAEFGTDAFNHLEFFRSLQRNNFASGRRNVAIMSQEAFDRLVEHPSFKQGGCAIPPLAEESTIASYLKVQEIVIADTAINTATNGAAFDLQRLWGDYILMTKSISLGTTDGERRGFGFSAYVDGFGNYTYLDEAKGKDEGVEMQKVSHDFTEIIADIKSATLVKI